MPGSVKHQPRLRVGILLTKRFTLCAFATFVDVLRLSADEGDRSRPILCQWRVLAAEMRPVHASCGTAIVPDERLGDPARFDYIVIIGGLIDVESDQATIHYLRAAAAANVPLVGICTGAFILHQAGLMEGYRCCVSWFHRDDFLERFDGLHPVSDQIFVVDRDRLTCSGGVSAAHLAAYLVDRHIGPSQARKSLQIMIIDQAMAAERPQPNIPIELTTSDTLVRRTLSLMQQNISSAPPILDLCKHLSVSRRKLERHFKSALGMTPADAFLHLRLSHAKFLLDTSSQPVTAIAAETGFCDGPHFSKVFRSHTGQSPTAWRQQETPARQVS